MKRFIFALCAVLLGCALLHPKPGFAEAYPAWIGTIQITDANREHLEAALGLSHGRITYFPATANSGARLELTDVSLENVFTDRYDTSPSPSSYHWWSYATIYAREDLTVKISGKNIIDQTGFSIGGANLAGIHATGSLTILGEGQLIVRCGATTNNNSQDYRGSDALYAGNVLTIGGRIGVLATGGKGEHGSRGLRGSHGIRIQDSAEVIAVGGDSPYNSFGCWEGPVEISGGTLMTMGLNQAIAGTLQLREGLATVTSRKLPESENNIPDAGTLAPGTYTGELDNLKFIKISSGSVTDQIFHTSSESQPATATAPPAPQQSAPQPIQQPAAPSATLPTITQPAPQELSQPSASGDEEGGNLPAPATLTYSEAEIAAAPTATAHVTLDAPEVGLAGLKVDFGPWNLEADSNLTVRTLPAKQDKSNGAAVQAWDFKLEGQSQFDLPVKLTFPYDPSIQNPQRTIGARYWNPTAEEWEYLPCEFDEANHTITASIDHFSLIGLVYQFFSSDEEQRIPRNLKVSLTGETLAKAIQTAEKEAEMGTLLRGEEKVSESSAFWTRVSKECGNVSTVMSASDTTFSLLSLLFPKNYTLSVTSEAIGNIGLGYAACNFMGDMGKELTKSKNRDTLAVYKKYTPDLITGLGILGAANPYVMTAWGAAQLCYSLCENDAIWVQAAESDFNTPMDKTYYGYTYNRLYWSAKGDGNPKSHIGFYVRNQDTEKLLPAIETLKKRTDPTGQTEAKINAMENLLKVSMATNGKASGKILHNPRQKNANGWLAMMNFVKDKYPRNPEKWLDEFLLCVDETANTFWSSNSELRTRTGEKAQRAAWARVFWPRSEKEVYTSMEQVPWDELEDFDKTSPDIITKMKNNIMKDLKENAFFQEFIEKYRQGLQTYAGNMLEKQKKVLNRPLTFKLNLWTDKGKKLDSFSQSSYYRDKYIVLDSDKVSHSEWKIRMKSPTLFQCTYYAWLQAGQPKHLRVYASQTAFAEGKAPLEKISIPFVPETNRDEVLITVGAPVEEEDSPLFSALKKHDVTSPNLPNQATR